ncbi:MAG: DMT family transporter [Chitinophagaceae bacterium]
MKNAFLKLHIAVFLAGFTGVLGRMIELNEGLLVWYRMFFTIIFLWIPYAWKKGLMNFPIKKYVPVYLNGALVASHWVFFYASIKYANVSVGLVCFSAIGFFTAVLEPILLKKPFKTIEILLGLLVILGIFLIFHFDPKFKLGILLGVVSSLLSTIFTIYNKRLLLTFSSKDLTIHELTGGWFFLSLVMPFYLQMFPTEKILPNTSDIVWLIFLSLFCTVLAFNLLLQALKKISPFTVNLSYNLEPVYGILLAFIIYGEYREISQGFYWGFSLIIIAVLLQSIRSIKLFKR